MVTPDLSQRITGRHCMRKALRRGKFLPPVEPVWLLVCNPNCVGCGNNGQPTSVLPQLAELQS